MRNISIIFSSIKEGKKRHNVLLYFRNYLIQNKLPTNDIVN